MKRVRSTFLYKEMHGTYPEKQIFVTEFGFSDEKDLRRPYWILETMRYIIEAKKAGVPVKGMLLWSLVNNFEWQLGMDQKFGLFNKSDLKDPLVPSSHGIKSWEAWRVATKAITSPGSESLAELQTCYEAAYKQYHEAGGKY
jgi:beta-glucosidase/6-phospho-beta-glucosidase/beta-galactosidase